MIRALGAVIAIVVGVIVFGALLTRAMVFLVPGAIVTSWYRTPGHNAEVGGLGGSAHLIGWAVDLIPVTGDVEDAARSVYPVVVNEGNHIHAALFTA